jgi:hypothetical protein
VERIVGEAEVREKRARRELALSDDGFDMIVMLMMLVLDEQSFLGYFISSYTCMREVYLTWAGGDSMILACIRESHLNSYHVLPFSELVVTC